MYEYTLEERLLGIEGLSLAYGNRMILRDINAEVINVVRPGRDQGQVVAILGPSGCGKTQLFRCIAGLNKPTSGKVIIRDSVSEVLPGQVGVVQQAYPLLNHRTVMGNLLISPKALQRDALDLLERFGLADKRNSYPVQLSGGQRQRVAIMQQLLMGNHFLLMDEPFSGLDILAKENVGKVIQEITQLHEDNTIIFTTHDIEVAVTLAEEIWIMGQTYDDEKRPLGATFVKKYDLKQMGIAWRPKEERSAKVNYLVSEIKNLFHQL